MTMGAGRDEHAADATAGAGEKAAATAKAGAGKKAAAAGADERVDAVASTGVGGSGLSGFSERVWAEGRRLYRDLPWRRTRDPYAIWISEVMLQQTQVSRVDGRWQRWLGRFPTVEALAAAPAQEVLDEWQGLGYNRRALMVHRAAGELSGLGAFPRTTEELVRLPGVGPATAAGIVAFAYDEPCVYLETNVRTVYLHELFPEAEAVPDRVLVPIIRDTCPDHDVRGWYYALLDYGAHLKRTVPNPSRRSAAHRRQSPFEGSRRQKRAWLLRRLLEGARVGEGPLPGTVLWEELARVDVEAGREAPDEAEVGGILADLAREGFCEAVDDGDGILWQVMS